MNRWRYFNKHERAIIAIALAKFALDGPALTEEDESQLREMQQELSREVKADPLTVAEAMKKGNADYLRVTGQAK